MKSASEGLRSQFPFGHELAHTLRNSIAAAAFIGFSVLGGIICDSPHSAANPDWSYYYASGCIAPTEAGTTEGDKLAAGSDHVLAIAQQERHEHPNYS